MNIDIILIEDTLLQKETAVLFFQLLYALNHKGLTSLLFFSSNPGKFEVELHVHHLSLFLLFYFGVFIFYLIA